jgi:hypothetical protein
MMDGEHPVQPGTWSLTAMAKKRLSRDQKRKAKLAERARNNAPLPSLAYTGNKYKTPALTPVVMNTERGILEAYVGTGRRLTDRNVKTALEKMVVQMRSGQLPPFEESSQVEYQAGREEDLVIWFIRRNWHDLFERFPNPGKDTLVGILRTLLSSVATWSTPSPESRGYLNFVEGFLRKAGVRVQRGRVGEEPEPEPADPLLDLGREWCQGDAAARARFLARAEELIDAGQGQHVAEVAQRLIGEINDTTDTMKELSRLAIRAQRAPQRLEGPANG